MVRDEVQERVCMISISNKGGVETPISTARTENNGEI